MSKSLKITVTMTQMQKRTRGYSAYFDFRPDLPLSAGFWRDLPEDVATDDEWRVGRTYTLSISPSGKKKDEST